ncbi:MAG TPA: TlpA disulfide reductase family protein [Bryobacteraceae bacterium]|jgi:peroxiredoxin|nr:TlpA disulfide reductase family protein [Bryobacteraceae bacterium]
MHSRTPAGTALALAALALFTIWITWRAKSMEMRQNHADESIVLLHKQAPDFHLESLDGRTISLADYRGKKKVVLTFWASWCGPCRMETPALREFYQQHAKSLGEFEILAINIDEFRGAAEDAAAEWKMPFPVLLDSQHKTADAYEVFAIPTLLVIDRNGQVEYGHVGFDSNVQMMLSQLMNFPVALVPGGSNGNASH